VAGKDPDKFTPNFTNELQLWIRNVECGAIACCFSFISASQDCRYRELGISGFPQFL
jgi:hypothetical protein